jgi:hypothetical protein
MNKDMLYLLVGAGVAFLVFRAIQKGIANGSIPQGPRLDARDALNLNPNLNTGNALDPNSYGSA